MLLESENNNYVNKYRKETKDKGIKYKGIKIIDFNKSINKDKSNKERIKDKNIKGLSIDINNKNLSKGEFKDSNYNFN